MSISPVGPRLAYPSYQAPQAPAVLPSGGAQPAAQAVPLYPSTPGYGQYPAAPSSGLGLGRLLSWAGGAFAAHKLILSNLRSPSAWIVGGVLIGGAWLGNKLFNLVTNR